MTLRGDLHYDVPDGMRMVVAAGEGGQPRVQLLPLEAPTWGWRYSLQQGCGVLLELDDACSSSGRSSSNGAGAP